jgi:glutamate/tyrosine decarboxylase-like PLP-dependent enzyme
MTNKRTAPIEINKEEFKTAGHRLIDTIAAFYDTIQQKPVTTGESSRQLQALLGQASLPSEGASTADIIAMASALLLDHSLLNGHPKFFGYITSSPAPIGALADLLAATVNPNVGAQVLSPMATQIELQTIQWLSEFIGVPSGYGGILVSGGNMANFTAFVAARTVKAPKNIKEEGISAADKLVVYCSRATHTWIEKAAVLFGMGSKSIHWVEIGADNKMKVDVLESMIQHDLQQGYKPIMVIGNAGDVSTGAVDDLQAIASISKAYDLWFHIDGAYGIPAAVLPELKEMFRGTDSADSIALDPHKWLYSPLEAGCTLVKDPNHLVETYSSHPVYYNFSSTEERTHNFYEYGFQNSRGFRALKVWMALQQVGRKGYEQMIREDIALSRLMYDLAEAHNELEAVTQNLSIATFRYVPVDSKDVENREDYLNRLNESLLNALQKGGEVFLSNAVIQNKYCLRACIVNFRTSKEDIEQVVDIIVKTGRKVHKELQEKLHTDSTS